MADAGTPERGILAERLDRLFETVQPLGRRYSLREVADGVNKQAGTNLLSFQHVAQLLKGERRRPGYDVLLGIARWFGVSAEYFTDDEVAQRTADEIALLNLMRDAKTRELAEQAAGLSEDQYKAVLHTIKAFQEANRLARAGGRPDISWQDPG